MTRRIIGRGRERAIRKAKPKQSKSAAVSDLEWVERYFRQRGSNWEFAQQNGAVLVTEAQARSRGFKPALPGIVFENLDPLTGALLGGERIRFQHPPTIEGKLRKFNQRPGTKPAPYLVRALSWKRIFANTKLPLIVSEGETRALAGAHHNMPVIALGGVYSGFVQGTRCSELLPILLKIKWKKRKVYIAFDADGVANSDVQRAEEKLAAALSALEAEVHIVRVPRLTSDGHTGIDDMLSLPGGVEMVKSLCNAAPVWNVAKNGDGTPSIERLADVEARIVEWLWKYRLPLGMIAGLEGNPGDGKTYLGLCIAAEGSRGREPYTGAKRAPFNTLYLSNENITAVTTKQRYTAMGGDERRFFVLKGAVMSDGTVRGITLADIHTIEKAVEKTDARLVIIDPLQSYMGADVDSHKANETRPLLDGLAKLAERLNICILIIRHLAKGSGNRAIHRGLGSIDITGAMRSVMMVGTAPDDPQNRALVHTKSNIGPLAESLRFAIEGKDLAAKLIWKGISRLTATDLAAPDGVKRKTQVELGADYLYEQLAGEAKPVSALVCEEFNERTLQRAALKIGVTRKRKGESGAWVWSLPKFAMLTEEERK